MGVTKKSKITFTCEPSLKDGLEVWAQSESRTVSNLIEMIVRQAYQERSTPDRPTEPQPATDPQPTETKPATVGTTKRGKASKGAS
ncbi:MULTISPECIES: ribbon-helix-helix domain-containing protein [unclassified Microcoleus]|uniref:ribbon-helix-helix domain-containing protein n=1 Tax=unclassified Microcoleus TaxID=2642155 RepID=UPI002FD6DB8A